MSGSKPVPKPAPPKTAPEVVADEPVTDPVEEEIPAPEETEPEDEVDPVVETPDVIIEQTLPAGRSMPPQAMAGDRGVPTAPERPKDPVEPVDPAAVETTASGLKFGWQQPPAREPVVAEPCFHMALVQARRQVQYQNVGDEWACTCGTVFEVVINSGGKKTLKEQEVPEEPVVEEEVVG